VHPPEVIAEALRLRTEAGLGARRVAQKLRLPVGTVRDWHAGRLPRTGHTGERGCPICGLEEHRFDELPPEYVFLLGLYLGDGCIATHPRNVFRLRVALDRKYPGIVNECMRAMEAALPASRAGKRLTIYNCYEVYSYSKAWPCLFPQHGPGKKHLRPIWLADWQAELVRLAPKQLLRGFIHSDGWRFINTGRGGWECPRYGFSNRSDDIRRIFCDTCELLGLHWTASGKYTIYVSRKTDVARMDEFIGPKR
jgi:hypothetical protein